MILPFILYAILVIWALVQGDLYPKEGAIHGLVWLACLAGFLFADLVRTGLGLWFVVPVCLADVYLLVKMVGNPNAF